MVIPYLRRVTGHGYKDTGFLKRIQKPSQRNNATEKLLMNRSLYSQPF